MTRHINLAQRATALAMFDKLVAESLTVLDVTAQPLRVSIHGTRY